MNKTIKQILSMTLATAIMSSTIPVLGAVDVSFKKTYGVTPAQWRRMYN